MKELFCGTNQRLVLYFKCDENVAIGVFYSYARITKNSKFYTLLFSPSRDPVKQKSKTKTSEGKLTFTIGPRRWRFPLIIMLGTHNGDSVFCNELET